MLKLRQVNSRNHLFKIVFERFNFSVEVTWFEQSCLTLDKSFALGILEVGGVVHSLVVDRVYLLFREPDNPLAVFPQTVLEPLLLLVVIRAQAVLLTLVPVALVLAPVCPDVNAKAVLLVVEVLTLINPAVSPVVQAEPFHVVIVPLAFVASTVGPLVNAQAANFVFDPITKVHASIAPLVSAKSVFAPVLVISLILTFVSPLFNAVPVLQIVLPTARVLRSIHVVVSTYSVRFVMCPVSFVVVAISVHEFSLSMSFVIFPHTGVASAIRPDLLPVAISEAAFPLSIVDSARAFVLVRRSLDSLLVHVVSPGLADSLTALLVVEVLAATCLFLAEKLNQPLLSFSAPSGLDQDNAPQVAEVVLIYTIVKLAPCGFGLLLPLVLVKLVLKWFNPKVEAYCGHFEFSRLPVLSANVGAIICTVAHI